MIPCKRSRERRQCRSLLEIAVNVDSEDRAVEHFGVQGTRTSFLNRRRKKEEKNGAVNPPLQVFQMSQSERRAEVFPQIQPVLLRNGHKHVDDRRVKLTPRAALDLFPGMGHR